MPFQTIPQAAPCPCGSGATFEGCCQPLLLGADAPSPEALMRSRYAALVVGDMNHVERTLTAQAHAEFNRSAVQAMAGSVEWLGLDIRRTEDGGLTDELGDVEFIARFKEGRQDKAHHELAHFSREDSKWLYADGTMNPKGKPVQVDKVGRNDPCPCGSGKKHKKCCGA